MEAGDDSIGFKAKITLLERNVTTTTDHQMIQHLDIEQPAGADDLPGNGYVLG